ncbi:hypothetical protein V8F33_008017, partial [Rhypophila sp. PSN 637]
IRHFAPDQELLSEPDATLSAFAQLAALRLGATRALISLIDGTKQHILAEAIQNSRLWSDWAGRGQDDSLLFGGVTLARSLGLCGTALDMLTRQKPMGDPKLWQPPSATSPLTVNDLAEDERFKNRAFVKSHPNVRYYAAVPITTKSGSNIGIIAVMDETPRKGPMGDAEARFLSDLARTAMAHLEMTSSSEGHRRSEKMIKGLGVFMEGRTDLNDWWGGLGENTSRSPDGARGGAGDFMKGESPSGYSPSASKEYGVPRRPSSSSSSSSPFRRLNPSDRTLQAGHGGGIPEIVSSPFAYTDAASSPDSPNQEHTARPSRHGTPTGTRAQSPTPSRGHSARTFTPDFQEDVIPGKIREMFSRAAHIMQESVEVDGALFLDASIGALGNRATQESVTSTVGKAEPNEAEEGACAVLGVWTSEKSSLHGQGPASLRPLAVPFLQTLLHKYPQGHVFSPLEEAKKAKGQSKKEVAQTEAEALGRMLPNTRSIAFVPLWDPNRSRWFAAAFIWTVLPTDRVLTRARDLNFLAAFGNSIMAEVARLDVVNADRAKSAFISSISHELRSPLHGILASVELLHDTTIDLFQRGMIDTIERCGRTLLDTIQHVLDFAKINNFTRSVKRGSEEAEGRPGANRVVSGIPSLSVDVDLSLLVEDVVDSVFAGHEFHGNSSLLSTDETTSGSPSAGLGQGSVANTTTESYGARRAVPKMEPIDVVLDIDWRPNWIFSTESGAVRRVLMNLVGNALKYTDRGWVKVTLQAEEIETSAAGPRAQSIVTIKVSDTGRGIAPEYLHDGLFEPFTQENPLNPGTGLGLSIVLQIVRSLGGRIDITSEEGVGTEAVVTLTMNQVPVPGDALHLDRDGEGRKVIQRARAKTMGRAVGLVGLNINPGFPPMRPGDWRVDAEPSMILHASVASTVADWFGMEATAPSTWSSSPPAIFISNQSSAIQAAGLPGVPIIVLCSREALHREYNRRIARGGRLADDGLVHLVSKPCGPHKLAKAFTFSLGDEPHSSSSRGLSPSTHSGPQSLFAKSPELADLPHRHVRDDHEYFPLTAEPGAVETPRPTDPPTAKQQPVLLLVEDNEINLRLLSTFVRKINYTYDTAVNGLEALTAVQVAAKPYDIIIMDITMPIMDGMEATREIRKLEHARRQKPALIIALTGLGSAASQKEAFDSGVNIFMTKPVRFKDMRKLLDEWFPPAEEGTDNGKPHGRFRTL